MAEDCMDYIEWVFENPRKNKYYYNDYYNYLTQDRFMKLLKSYQKKGFLEPAFARIEMSIHCIRSFEGKISFVDRDIYMLFDKEIPTKDTVMDSIKNRYPKKWTQYVIDQMGRFNRIKYDEVPYVSNVQYDSRHGIDIGAFNEKSLVIINPETLKQVYPKIPEDSFNPFPAVTEFLSIIDKLQNQKSGRNQQK